MRYAVLSDIHGNLGALEAALADIERSPVDAILLLGDYIIDFPSANEVLDRLRALPNAIVIRGNKERYLLSLDGMDPSRWTSEQFAPTTACRRALTPRNLDYLRALPDERKLEDPFVGVLHMQHWIEPMLHAGRLPELHSDGFRARVAATGYDHAAYLRDLAALFGPGGAAHAGLMALSAGLYLAGHNHMQGHARAPGRGYINPGSCGLPLDGDVRPAYAVLTTGAHGWSVDERRVAVDEAYEREALRAMRDISGVWSGIVARSRREGLDQFMRMLRHVKALSDAPGSLEAPHSDADWRRAYAAWSDEVGEG